MMRTGAGSIAPLDPAAPQPLYRQIYDRFRSAIASGLLEPGDRVPSVRALTQELGLARGTIEAAYSLLTAEGYFLARGQAGTIVSPALAAGPLAPARPPQPAGGSPAFAARVEPIRPFQMGLPALDAFPRKIWARLGARAVRAMQHAGMAYPATSGLQELRTEIAAYLQVSRGIACAPAQIFLTSGYRHTLELIVRALLRPGERVWHEDPGYPPTRELLEHAGLEPVPVPVDGDGLVVEQGLRVAPGAGAAVVTPAHQSPLCVSLSLPRRLALLDWAQRNRAWIVEDDYDGEYRYVSRPLPALKSLDRDGRVLYAGTFSKVLFPGLRLAYLAVPESLVERFEQTSRVFAGGGPALTQEIVRAFIAEGHFARHIQRMRKLYAQRREAVAAGLAAVLDGLARIDPQPGGMHLVVRLEGGRSDESMAARLRAHGMYAHALSRWAVHAGQPPALLMGFTNIDTRETAEQLARNIRRLL